MTYSSVITTDAPQNWFRLADASGSTVVDSGSVGGTASVTGSPLFGQPSAGYIDGNSMYFASGQTITKGITGAQGTTFTVEFWFKRDTAVSGQHDVVRTFNAGSSQYFNISMSATAISVSNSSQYLANTTTHWDGAWHHIGVVCNAGAVNVYVDGVSKGSTTGLFMGTNATSGTTIVYGSGANQLGACWIDEIAYYKKAVTQARLLAHYNEGMTVQSTPVTVTPPAATMSLAAPAVVTSVTSNTTQAVPAIATAVSAPDASVAVSTNITTAVPAVAGSIAAPAVSLSTDSSIAVPAIDTALAMPDVISRAYTDTAVSAPAIEMGSVDAPGGVTTSTEFHRTVTAPAEALSIAMPVPNVYMVNSISVAAPAMTVSLTSVAPVKVEGVNVYVPTQDRGKVGSNYSGTAIEVTAPYLVKFPDITVGKHVTKATLTFTSQTSGSISISLASAAWTESGTTDVGAVAGATIVSPAQGTNGIRSIDVTSLASRWADGTNANYGFVLSWSDTARTIRTREYGATGPSLALVFGDQSHAINEAPVVALDIAAIDASVSTTYAVSNSVPAITAGLGFVGGIGTAINPDFTGEVPAMSVNLFTPVVDVAVRYPVTVDIPSMYVGNLENEPATINLTTNRLAVAPAIKINMKWIGIYMEEADRYLARLNSILASGNNVWYKLGGETAGATRLIDSAGTRYDGYVFGTPDFNIPDGPELRKAAHFDGIDDYLVVGPYTTSGNYDNTQDIRYGDHAVTIEFSIRTTQLDGTVFNAAGGGNGAAAAISQTYFALPAIKNKLNLKNGYLHVIDDMLGTKTLTRSGFISDGEWHHVVMSMPVSTTGKTGLLDDIAPSFIMVDGKIVLARYGLTGGEGWAPYAFMADADFQPSTPVLLSSHPQRGNNVTGYLAGDLRDVIVRLNQYTDIQTAQTTYYEWSDSAVMNPGPMTVSLAGVNPSKVKGNTKRMLAIYGLPTSYNGATGQFTGFEPLNTYKSKWSGFIIQSFEGSIAEFDRNGWHRVLGTSVGAWVFQTPAVFSAGDFVVYPVSITGAGAPSVDGIRNPDAETDSTGQFVDYETGLPRFIDLQNDLSEPITDFDAVTVVNYPWTGPNGYDVPKTGVNNPGTNPLDAPEFGMYQRDMGMTNSEWGVARDNLRDSILEAVYEGVNLWIGEYHMAQHLGFINQIDIHDSGWWYTGEYADNTNFAGRNLDMANLTDVMGAKGTASKWIEGGNGYYSYPQMNIYRRVVSEVPGLTDLPTNEITAMVEGWSKDEWKPNGSFLAYNIDKRPNGLVVGDRVFMDVMFRRETKWDSPTEAGAMTGFEPSKRIQIVSARPQGIVGRVVTSETDFYSGPNGVAVANPYKDNAYTIAVERGSVVRGRPIRGRVFIELMDLGARYAGVQEDKNKMKWNGDNVPGNVAPSNWSFDTRRYKEVKLQNVTTVFSIASSNDAEGSPLKTKEVITNYFSYEEFNTIGYRKPSWHLRGLHWLSLTPDVSGDDFIGYAPAMTVDLRSPAPTASFQKAPLVAVNGAMRLDLEVRQPANYQDGSITERALPMELSLEVRGLGTTAQVPPMVIDLSTVAPVIDADAETLIVYMDNTNTVTLFIKEES
jgi:hypothetical protein